MRARFRNLDFVVKRHRHHDCIDEMVAVFAFSDHAQSEIDFSRSSNLHAPLGNIAFSELRRTPIMSHEIAKFLAAAWEAADAAGTLIRESWQEPKRIDYKGAIDLVTSIDRECERRIVEVLQRNFPHHSILAEEETNLIGTETN